MSADARREALGVRSSGSLEEEAALCIRRAAETIEWSVTELLARHELTPVQYGVLKVLRAAGPAGLKASDIGALMRTPTPDATRLVDRLERHGRVRRDRTPEDRRIVLVRITESGRRTLAELDLPLAALHRRQLGGLGAAKLTQLIQLLAEFGSAG